MPTSAVFDIALDLASRYSLSHWDSMLVGACKAAGVVLLYTEDMGAPRVIDGVSLTINDLPGPDSVQISLIPFTREHTTLGTLRVDVFGLPTRRSCGCG